ncbi:MAG: zinc ribbon domain-containing protein [Gemmatimonadales bacterium]
MIEVVMLALVAAVAPSRAGLDVGGQDPESIARPDLRIHAMEIDIWPEYDDPRVLVIYRGVLEADADLPTPFTIVIPRGAQIHMAGALGEEGEHLHAQFETLPRGDSLAEVRYDLTARTFYMEFYYDPLTDEPQRDFQYPLLSDYPVSQMVVRVQQPLKATDFRTSPAALDIVADNQGFNYHRFQLQDLKPDEPRVIAVSYTKRGREPSVARAGTAQAGGNAMRTILIIAAMGLLGVVAYAVLSARRSHGAGQAVAASGSRRPPPSRGRDIRYCTECGEKMRSGDNYCPACGAPSAAVEVG